MLDVWVSLSATGLCFGTLFLLGHRVIFKAANTPFYLLFFFSLLEYAKDFKVIFVA